MYGLMVEYKASVHNFRVYLVIALLLLFFIFFLTFISDLVRLPFLFVIYLLFFLYFGFSLIRYVNTKIVLDMQKVVFHRIFSKPIEIAKKDITSIVEDYRFVGIGASLQTISPGSNIADPYGIIINSTDKQIFIDFVLFPSAYNRIKAQLKKNFKKIEVRSKMPRMMAQRLEETEPENSFRMKRIKGKSKKK
jgi:hypothetical protein